MGAKVILYIENDALENKIFPFFMIVFFLLSLEFRTFVSPKMGFSDKILNK